jgi:hypothetical protein|tara:strand:+ start:1825 stop:3528 length:1704 start_codon:yes stop_codon:yes gene_type:complete
MAVNNNIIAHDLFKTIKGFNLNIQLFNEDGKRVIDPAEARKFYATDKKFMVTYESDEDPQSIKVYFGKNFTLDEGGDFPYNKFIKQVRNLAHRKNAIDFTVKNYGKEIQPKDFAYQAINRNADMGNIAEGLSPAYGSSKSSYQTLDNAKLVIRHNKPVDESARGSRARNITALFVENSAGERFKYPYNHLAAARAMTRHVAEGGTPYDNIGSYITKLSEESLGLTKFMRYSKSNGLMNEDTEPVIGGIKTRLNQVKESLKRMSTHRGYASVVETLGETKKELDEQLVDELKNKFTVVRFDEDMESVLPYVARIVSEMNNSSRISETYDEFKEAVSNAGEIQVQMVEADHPENPANLMFDNVTKKNQHIINFMAEHILDENVQTLMKQVAVDFPRYDVPMKNESLALVKSIMETGQTPVAEQPDTPMEESFIDELDEAFSKFASNDIFFEKSHIKKPTLEPLKKPTLKPLKKPTLKPRDNDSAEGIGIDTAVGVNSSVASTGVNPMGVKRQMDRKSPSKKARWKKFMTDMPNKGYRTKSEIQAMKKELSAEAVGEADDTVLKLAGVYK